jgi:integrase
MNPNNQQSKEIAFMSVYKPSGSRFWWVAVYVPGSRSRYVRTSTRTEDKAKAKAVEQTIGLAMRRTAPAEHLHALIDALLGQSATRGTPIGGIWDAYERAYRIGGRTVADKTLGRRKGAVMRLEAWIMKMRPRITHVKDIDRSTAADYAEDLRKSGAKSKTRRNVISELTTVWKALQATQEISNHWGGVAPDVTDSKTGQSFSRDQESRLFRAADAAGHDWGMMCRLARCTGLRYGDIAGLTAEDVDRPASAIRLTPAKTLRHKIAVTLPIPEKIFALIKDKPGPLFPEAFSCLPRQMSKHPFSRVLSEAGLAGAGYTFHSWRHTFRTRLSEAGVSDDIAKRLGGWTQDKTAERYDHADRLEELRKAVEKAM